MNMTPVYLDYAATTPLDPAVRDAMRAVSGDSAVIANPASAHVYGRQSAAVVARAREQLGRLINAPAERIVWTSGATESNNLAILGAARYRAHKGKHLVTMPTEHKAVVNPFRALQKSGFEVTWLEPQADGRVNLDELQAAIRPDTQLVSIMHVNNETGALQDIAAIGRQCREHDVLFHTDAAQSTGKVPLDVEAANIDLLSVSGHKIYGPQGIGALFVNDRPGCNLEPLVYGGDQEQDLRPGTLPVVLIAGLGAAAEVAAGKAGRRPRARPATRRAAVERDC